MSSENYYSFKKKPDSENAFVFTKPDETIVKKLKGLLEALTFQPDRLIIEPLLKQKRLRKYESVEELLDLIVTDLNRNYMEYSKEFEGKAMGFEYYLGNELFFKDSVEIVQKIFHERNDLGELYYSLVIKRINGVYYYWNW